jgi:hypothetical protein
MAESLQLIEARSAKEKAKQIFSRYGFVNGIGLTRLGGRYAVKVNFETEPFDSANLPEEIEGVPVVVRIVGPLHKQTNRS